MLEPTEGPGAEGAVGAKIGGGGANEFGVDVDGGGRRARGDGGGGGGKDELGVDGGNREIILALTEDIQDHSYGYFDSFLIAFTDPQLLVKLPCPVPWLVQ